MKFEQLKSMALDKNQMRAIKGGHGTCGYLTSSGTYNCGVTKDQALHMTMNGTDGYWCCDSCAATRYCGNN